MLQICKEAYEMFKQHGLLYTSFYLEVNIPGTDNNTSPTCSSTFLYTKLGVIEGGQFTSTTARIFSIPAILILQIRSCDNCSIWQIGLETKYGIAPVLTPGPVVAVVVVPVEELFAEDKLSVTTGAEAFSALKNTLE